ncbi:RNA polymerase sigma-70 factor (ECF subfamily) [Nocardiopsis sp. Huas11]|uniref:RNA polymerase sigma factor SigJ n=1 Tax=Nocardiopsis sp. Huas11 TaxID=2183912 RepID=UPI000EAEB1D9|nr:RNA polymerase sigma factor SigJ [Nocardiopsis sp. Huas11]RKS06233.1 RNA polymerase sigma-70 factor (ECF subfamily) [Nocardiopsis sp. Huas11]
MSDPATATEPRPPGEEHPAGPATAAITEASAADDDEATAVYVEHRELLFSIVYGMLGTVTDTEDVLQEAWLSWAARVRDGDARPIDNPRGYLVRVAVNQALARQEAIRRRKEAYLGPWLPEPLVTEEDAAQPTLRAESVSVALLVVLESLSPLERAVFVLHEVFGYAHTEIAAMLGRTPAAVRQLGHRARRHVRARRPRYRSDPRVQRRVTERFVAATTDGDLATLLELLAPDVTMWNDGGGKVPRASRRLLHGGDKVARFLIGVARPGTERAADRFEAHYRGINGTPSAVLTRGGRLFGVMALELTPEGDRIQAVYTVANPDKLAHVRDAEPGGAPARPDRPDEYDPSESEQPGSRP